jgi:hypothetical protein
MSKNSRRLMRNRRIDIQAALEQIRVAAEAMNSSRSRYAAYEFLLAVYEPYWGWIDAGHYDAHITASIRRKSDRRYGKNEHPVKMLIRAANCSLEAKVLSRWVRALEYALLKSTRPKHLSYFFEHHGGIAGCATLAAKMAPKRTPPPDRDDWADDSPVRHISEN